jgi:hypothetical protein
MEKYDVPDEHLSYSELKDRVRVECARVLPKKERILLLAKKLEEDLTLKDTICQQICTDMEHATSVRHIQDCLPDEYKQKKKKKSAEQSTGELTNSSLNDDKKVPEQKSMTVNTSGYEEAFEDTSRGPDVQPASEIVDALKKN